MTDRPGLHSLRDILPVSGTMYRVEGVEASFSVHPSTIVDETQSECLTNSTIKYRSALCRRAELIISISASLFSWLFQPRLQSCPTHRFPKEKGI